MRKRSIKTPLQSFLITTTNDAEFQYFSQMKKDCRYRNMIIEKVVAVDLMDLLVKTNKIKCQNKYKFAWAIASLAQFGKKSSEISDELKFADSRRIGLAYADPSILLYFALHYESIAPGATESFLTNVIKKYIPSFNWTEDYLLGEGNGFNLTLIKEKAKEGAHENELNMKIQTTQANVSALNFMQFMNSVAEVCGEADIAYNQKVIS